MVQGGSASGDGSCRSSTNKAAQIDVSAGWHCAGNAGLDALATMRLCGPSDRRICFTIVYTAHCLTQCVEKLTNEHEVRAFDEISHVESDYKSKAVKVSIDAVAEFFNSEQLKQRSCNSVCLRRQADVGPKLSNGHFGL